MFRSLLLLNILPWVELFVQIKYFLDVDVQFLSQSISCHSGSMRA